MATEKKNGKIEILAGENAEDETSQTFVIHEEDHTLGNSLRYIIMKNPEVQFCGYNIPHPSENKINFRIQTRGEPAIDILKRGLKDLHHMCEHTQAVFENSVALYRKIKPDRKGENMDVDSS